MPSRPEQDLSCRRLEEGQIEGGCKERSITDKVMLCIVVVARWVLVLKVAQNRGQ